MHHKDLETKHQLSNFNVLLVWVVDFYNDYPLYFLLLFRGEILVLILAIYGNEVLCYPLLKDL